MGSCLALPKVAALHREPDALALLSCPSLGAEEKSLRVPDGCNEFYAPATTGLGTRDPIQPMESHEFHPRSHVGRSEYIRHTLDQLNWSTALLLHELQLTAHSHWKIPLGLIC